MGAMQPLIKLLWLLVKF